MDSITLVRAAHRRLTKLIHADGSIDDYDNARRIDLICHPIVDLSAVQRLLLRLISRADIAVVRGAIAASTATQRVRRLLHTDTNTGEAPTLCDVPRRWLALDLDGLEKPDSIKPSDLSGCAKCAIQYLPVAFRRAACIAQASASHGIKPGIRMRLWFWLDRPVSGIELRRWFKGTPIDPSIFGAAQLIYTAKPLFAPGAAEHLALRITAIEGEAAVRVPSVAALAPPSRLTAPLAYTARVNKDRLAFGALRNAVARVSGASVGSRHPTLVAEACKLARLVEANLLTSAEMRSSLVAAAALTGKPDQEVMSVIDWALTHPSNLPLVIGG